MSRICSQSEGTVIAQIASEIGGDAAISYLPHGYSGRCAIVTESAANIIGVLPDPLQAFRVAAYAIAPAGGYGSVGILPTLDRETHQSLREWVARESSVSDDS